MAARDSASDKKVESVGRRYSEVPTANSDDLSGREADDEWGRGVIVGAGCGGQSDEVRTGG